MNSTTKGEIMKQAIVMLTDGVEECEALLAVDILRRAGIAVATASIMGRTDIRSSHGICIQADALAEDVDFAVADLLVLPGGLPGTTHLSENTLVKTQCLAFAKDRLLAAICAAPSVLASWGLLDGKPATCHPAFEAKMGRAILTHQGVAVAENIITGQGLGAAIPFALSLVETLLDGETADEIAQSISFWRDTTTMGKNNSN